MIELAVATFFSVAVSSGLAFWLAYAAGFKSYGWMIVVMTALAMILMCTDFHRAGLYLLWFTQLLTGLMYWILWRKRLVSWNNPTPKSPVL